MLYITPNMGATPEELANSFAKDLAMQRREEHLLAALGPVERLLMDKIKERMLADGYSPTKVGESMFNSVRAFRESQLKLIRDLVQSDRQQAILAYLLGKRRQVLRPGDRVPVYGPERLYRKSEPVDPLALIAERIEANRSLGVILPPNPPTLRQRLANSFLGTCKSLFDMNVQHSSIRRTWALAGAAGIFALERQAQLSGLQIDTMGGSLLFLAQIGMALPTGVGIASEVLARLKNSGNSRPLCA